MSVKCKTCDGRASLLDRKCRNNILQILLSEPIPDHLILAGLLETLYEDDALDLLRRMVEIARMIDQFGKRPARGGGDACSRCVRGPGYVFRKISKAFERSLPSFQREIRIQASGLSPKKGRCRECVLSTRSDIGLLSSETEKLKSFILRSAFMISGSSNAISMEPRPLVSGLRKILMENSSVRPCFSSSWVASTALKSSEVIASYEVDGEDVKIGIMPDNITCIYGIVPTEYRLSRNQIRLIDLVISELMKDCPENVPLESLAQTYSYVKKEAERLIPELSSKHEISIGSTREEELERCEKLSEIVAKYTAGLGVIETLLKDEHIQDIYADAPASLTYVHITLDGISDDRLSGRLRTNIRLGENAGYSLLSKFMLESGRPFSESMPILEHNLASFGTRVTVVGPPLSPKGLAIAMRRHSVRPWTLPKLIANRTLSSDACGLISFLIDGRSTILIAGARGAGKSSLLGAMMLEFPQSQRIITIEDTLELPTSLMQRLGFRVQSLHVRSSLGGKGEMTADEALRVSLRLGESALVLGEVRGQEARTLYEAMRAGTAGSSVLGTFHADSAKAVYERVVHDMGINPRSFAATDVVIICGLTRPGGSEKEKRRITQIAELVKDEDGLFRDLMSYDELEDALASTGEPSECIARIAKSWGMSLEEARESIKIRSRIRGKIVHVAEKLGKKELLEAPWVIRCNHKFRQLMENQDIGEALKEWKDWFSRVARYA